MKSQIKAVRFYEDYLYKELRSIKSCAHYLNAAIEEGDLFLLLAAVRNIAIANGFTIQNLSKLTKIHRVNLYKIFSKNGNPLLVNVQKILNALGFQLAIVPLKKKKRVSTKNKTRRKIKK